ncbi:hypothetical protein [Roseixanthobacter pseudopolyaromaticivorans]|uniref:hypothetical protein n=1 Tax=Xanthobacteraceae TaxID=335928 RepID=UPI00372B6932
MLKRAILAPSVVLALGIGVAGFAAGGLAFADGATVVAKSTDRLSASEGTSQFAVSTRPFQVAEATVPGPRDRQADRWQNADEDLKGARRPDRGPGPVGGQMVAAASLSTMETYIGIRADQLDAWRAYTNAVLALLQPPKPPQEEPKPAAFERAEAIATHMADQGTKAQAVLAALTALKSKLTEDQLQRAAELSALLPPGPPRGPLAFAFGAPLAPPMPPPGVEHPHLGGHGPQALPDPSDADAASRHPRPAL